jgi:hypothetical protein
MPSESPRESAYTTYTNQEVTGPPTYRSPMPEGFAAQYFPYRGTEFHGVDPKDVPVVKDEDTEGGKVDTNYYDPPQKDIAPVPVRIVDTAVSEYQRWQAFQIPVNSVSPILVGSIQDGRTSLKVRNAATSGTTRIFIGPHSSVTTYTGYPLGVGDEVSFQGEAPVWAIAESGTVPLAGIVEYTSAE